MRLVYRKLSSSLLYFKFFPVVIACYLKLVQIKMELHKHVFHIWHNRKRKEQNSQASRQNVTNHKEICFLLLELI